MATRTIQFKRNNQISANAAAAKTNVLNIASSLVNGEIVLNSYYDSNARGGIATLVAVKTNNDKIFFVDNQVILNKLGINDDGSVNSAITNSVENVIDGINELLTEIVNGAGLNSDGTYVVDATDAKLSGATSLADADKKLSDAIQDIEDVIGAGGGSGSIVDRITTISGDVETLTTNLETVSGDVITLEGKVETLTTNLETVSGDVITLEGKVDTLTTNLETVSGDVITLEGKVDTLSGKTITSVEDTDTIDFTKEAAADGTQKIKADVKLSATQGNILSATSDGLYTSVDYNSVTNAIVINGVEKVLNVGSIVDDIRYDASTQELIIDYTKSDGTSGETKADLSALIDVYDFAASDVNHNVHFTTTVNESGATVVQGDVSTLDCGEY